MADGNPQLAREAEFLSRLVAVAGQAGLVKRASAYERFTPEDIDARTPPEV
ncbi:hypothetical protein [Amycolatopsis oliviviridis]|nr:hypothetical protein [Amycolatopsis oliviviridis]